MSLYQDEIGYREEEFSAHEEKEEKMKSVKFKEPYFKREYYFELIKGEKLEVGDFQRDIKTSLTNKIKASILTMGFSSVPVVTYDEDKRTFKVIDGQHRIMALIELLDAEVFKETLIPCLIVPSELNDCPLHLNLEQGDSIKDKCDKIYKLYQKILDERGDLKESEILTTATNGELYIIPTSLAYVDKGLSSPSLIEGYSKKFCNLIPSNESIRELYPIREEQADTIVLLEQVINQTAEGYYIKDFQLKKAILSKTTSALWGRQRKFDLDFKEAFIQICDYINETDWSFLSER